MSDAADSSTDPGKKAVSAIFVIANPGKTATIKL
jgi:hypothetical protein